MPRLRWVLLATAFGLASAVLLTAYAFEASRIARLSQQVDQRMDTLVRMNRELERLRDSIAYYKTTEGMARLAREQFNLAYPDERIYRIVVVSGEPPKVLPRTVP